MRGRLFEDVVQTITAPAASISYAGTGLLLDRESRPNVPQARMEAVVARPGHHQRGRPR